SAVTGVPRTTLVALQPELAVTNTVGGQVMVGGVWSRTTTNCWQVAVLPLVSVAVQVTVFVPKGKLAGALLVTLASAQLSLATGAARITLVALQAELAATITVGGQVMVGGLWSRTTTCCWQEAVFPLVSLTVQVTTFVPAEKLTGALLLMLPTAQLSLVTGTPKATFVALQPELAAMTRFGGQVMVGGIWSRTTTNCRQVAVLPLLSTAVQVTEFVPGAKPAGAELVTVAIPQASAVTGVPRITLVALQPELAVTNTVGGQVMVGGVWSRTTTICEQEAEFPLASTTNQVTKFVPTAKLVGASLVTLATLQLSAVTGTPRATLVALQPELAAMITVAGQVIVGGIWSRTTTSCWQVAGLPLVSLTVQVTALVPTGKTAGASFVTL